MSDAIDRARELLTRTEGHTQGPWTVVGELTSGGLGIDHIDDDDPDGPRSSAVLYARGAYMPPHEADARAIAALPDLRAVLAELVAEA